MANKTTQALKISATITLKRNALGRIEDLVLDDTALDKIEAASAKVRVTHAIAASYDDPAYSARATERIAAIKDALAKFGEIETWHVTAGAVPVDDAEVLAEPEQDKPVDWNNAAEAKAALDAGKLPDGFYIDGLLLIAPNDVTLGKLQRGHSAVFAHFDEIRNEAGVVLKSRKEAGA